MPSDGKFGVFALSSSADHPTEQDLVQVDDRGRATRQRRWHTKSRDGCTACKKSRIKCDERRPTCGRCSVRKIECTFELSIMDMLPMVPRDLKSSNRPMDHTATVSSIETTLMNRGLPQCSPSSLYGSESPYLNLTSMQLMYHFEHSTSATLVFGNGLWRDKVLPLALQHECLMHAVLMISASHLHYLQPGAHEYTKAMTHHLDITLSDFRNTLSNPLAEQDTDIIIACAFILLHYSWSTPFFSLEDSDSSCLTTGPDTLIPFAAGLKSIIMSTKDMESSSSSIFKAALTSQSVKRFRDWTESIDCPLDFEGYFFRRRKVAPQLPERDCWIGCGALDAVDRLVPILRAIDAASRGDDIADLMLEIQAYSLMWPAKSSKEFEKEVRENKMDALVVMLSFYASTWWLLSEEVWWAERRSKVMCEAILAHLEEEVDSEWDQNVKNICEYFGFKTDSQGKWVVPARLSSQR